MIVPFWMSVYRDPEPTKESSRREYWPSMKKLLLRMPV